MTLQHHIVAIALLYNITIDFVFRYILCLAVKTLSKKEQKRKDLADLEALLSDLGLKVEVEESTTTTAQRAGE